ncbi:MULTISPECIES: potassium/proton antiporter [unclassified Clostridium]|uniref:potassium/proton antiporter n=1 Tax=unclassified Clostridium TaxID=2614128 RepID=UPI0025C027F5|nr:potassium/proton antiporter [Clostridium sp.]MCI6692316.1 potassium/proton antiporter [Clostridium sp.]MDY2630937.1 potassium/proton antiporter [Clostridium sp.]MDY4253976.1 potassium/proton antiporter [Clostridium sp.]
MIELMIVCGLILLICISSSKILYKFGIPMLLIFIVLGMIFGSDGIVGIYFDNYQLTSIVSSLALVFIMFYGGFGTNWKMARKSAVPSILMSSFGVIITAGLTGLFCHYVLKTSILEGLLIGAVVGSTDAASVFSVLRSQKLNLKGTLAPLLEIESGSNDPIAYMLTIIILTLMSNGGVSLIIPMLIKQILFGIITGSILARISVYILKRANFEVEGFYTIFVTAVAILSYALSEYIGGNGYLSVYMAGIILGNNRIPHKKSLVHFFDGLSWIMQIGLFFVLGLLAFPSKLPEVFVISIAISLFMMFIARPLATFIILKWFDYSNKEKIFISWVGFRGAASIVFAIYTVTYGVDIGNDIFHIIFFIALLSVSIQGTFTPILAKKLDLVDDNMPVLKTFNDYKEDKSTKILEINIDENSKWVNKTIMDSDIPEEVLVVMIRRNNEVIIPKGSTEIKKDDILVLASNSFDNLLAN